jgi:hypothetical protein
MLAGIVGAATVALAAQAPNSSTPQAPATSAPQQSAGAAPQVRSPSASETAKAVTFSGCIDKAPAESGAAAPGVAAAPRWLLTNVSSAAGGAVGTSGTAKPAASYRLDADDAKISPHAGHKVEVTGTLEESSAASSSSAGATAPTLKVSAIKMVAAVCT